MSHTACTPAGNGVPTSWAKMGSVIENSTRILNRFIRCFLSSQAHFYPFGSATGFDGMHQRLKPVAIAHANRRTAHVTSQPFEGGVGHPVLDRHNHPHELRWNS